MRHSFLMLVLSSALCVAFLFLVGCHGPVPVAHPVYGSASDAIAVDPALPAPVIRRSIAAPSIQPVPVAPKRVATPVRPARRAVQHRTPAPTLPVFAPTECTSPFG